MKITCIFNPKGPNLKQVIETYFKQEKKQMLENDRKEFL